MFRGYIISGYAFVLPTVSDSLPPKRLVVYSLLKALLKSQRIGIEIAESWYQCFPPQGFSSLVDFLQHIQKIYGKTTYSLADSDVRSTMEEVLSLISRVWSQEEHGFFHHITDCWKELYFDSLLAETLTDLKLGATIATGVEYHIDNQAWNCFSASYAAKLGILEPWKKYHEVQLKSLFTYQREDGSLPYIPPRGKIQKDEPSVAPGQMAAQLLNALEFMQYTGEQEMLDAMNLGADFLATLPLLPYGGQTWELDVNIPDVLTASNLCRFFCSWSQLTKQSKYLSLAQHWALASIPFLQPWSPAKGVRTIAVIPAFGITRDPKNGSRWVGFETRDTQSWWDVSCPWVTLELAETYLRLNQLTMDSSWRNLASGMVLSVLYMLERQGGLGNGIPDAWSLKQNLPPYAMNVVPRNLIPLLRGLKPDIFPDHALINSLKNQGQKPVESELYRQWASPPPELAGQYPTHAYVDLTGRCNIKCPICPHTYRTDGVTNRPLMSDTVIERIQRSLFPHVKAITFSLSGESLLHPRAKAMLREAAKYSFLPILLENGTLLDEEVQEILVDAGGYVRISVDGARKESFERLRAGAKFAQVMGRVKRVSALAREKKATRFCLRFDVTISSENIEELPDIVVLAHQCGVKEVFYHYVYVDNIPRKDLDAFPHRHRIAPKLLECLRKGVEYDIFVAIPETPDADCAILQGIEEARRNLPPHRMQSIYSVSGPERTYHCQVPFQDVIVKPDGNISYCCLLSEDVHLGNLEMSEFEDIWFSDTYQQLRRDINSCYPPAQCHPQRCGIRKPFFLSQMIPSTSNQCYPTSAYPNLLRYTMDLVEVQRTETEGIKISLRVTNAGDTCWLNSWATGVSPTGNGVVRLCVYRHGLPRFTELHRWELPRNIFPGDRFNISFTLPRTCDEWLSSGFTVDLVCEGIAWFSDLGQSPMVLTAKQLLEFLH